MPIQYVATDREGCTEKEEWQVPSQVLGTLRAATESQCTRSGSIWTPISGCFKKEGFFVPHPHGTPGNSQGAQDPSSQWVGCDFGGIPLLCCGWPTRVLHLCCIAEVVNSQVLCKWVKLTGCEKNTSYWYFSDMEALQSKHKPLHSLKGICPFPFFLELEALNLSFIIPFLDRKTSDCKRNNNVRAIVSRLKGRGHWRSGRDQGTALQPSLERRPCSSTAFRNSWGWIFEISQFSTLDQFSF